MKILLAPSETKRDGGDKEFNLDELFLPQINSIREELIDSYLEVLNSNDMQKISKMFGLKKEAEILKYIKDITKEPTMLAIKRYIGVAFDFLDYDSLNLESKEYIKNSVLIFSNLFGVIRAKDYIPNYRLKQGEQIDNLKVDSIYKKALKEPLDAYLQNEDILDIRANYYNRFYKPSKFYTTLKFLKDGKVVSHWAKAYRGIILRELAINKVKNIDDFFKLNIQNLEIEEIRKNRNFQEIIYKILD